MLIAQIVPTKEEITIKLPKELIGKEIKISASRVKKSKREKLLEALLKAPTITDEEAEEMERVIKEGWGRWKIEEF